MIIVEKDLFKFIFYPEYLSNEKFQFISLNKNNFSDEIDFLLKIKETVQNSVNIDVLEKIKSKLQQKKANFIQLQKTNNKFLNSNYSIFLSESPKLERDLRSDTYRDAKSNYLVKVITNKDENRIYFFANNTDESAKLTINLEPSGESFIIEYPQKTLIISPSQEITGITISEDED